MGFEYKPDPTHWCHPPDDTYGFWWNREGYSSSKDAVGTVWSCDECGQRYRWSFKLIESIDYVSMEYRWKRKWFTFFRKTTNKGDNDEG